MSWLGKGSVTRHNTSSTLFRVDHPIPIGLQKIKKYICCVPEPVMKQFVCTKILHFSFLLLFFIFLTSSIEDVTA